MDQQDALVRQLSEEYKILQDKIDKIGGFRFTIKGWSLTLVVAGALAGNATKFTPTWRFVILTLLITIVLFFIEKVQSDLSRAFMRRIEQLETVLSGLVGKKDGQRCEELRKLHFIPGIARHLRQTRPSRLKRALDSLERFANRRNWAAVAEIAASPKWRRVKECWDADLWFYVLQFVVVLAVLNNAPTTPEKSEENHCPPQSLIYSEQTSNASCGVGGSSTSTKTKSKESARGQAKPKRDQQWLEK